MKVSTLIGYLHEFQFTHPGRGATTDSHRVRRIADVSIHAPREGCDLREAEVQAVLSVSIHAPREGCDMA